MKNLAFSVTFAASMIAGTAFAGGPIVVADDPIVAAPVVVAAPNGDWTGFYAGLAYGRHDAELSLGGAAVSADDTALGAFLGYNQDFGQYVVGGELSFDRASEEGTDIDLWRLKGRLGYDAGNWMPYATLGLARAEASDATGSITESGMTYGIGVDFAVTPNFILGAEVGRSSFSDVAGSSVDLDIDSLQIRASYKF